MIDFPEIGTYSDVAQALRMSKKTIYKKVSLKHFRKGIYIGSGRFNMSKLQKCIEKDGTCWNE
jgi:predicted DNA-binding transcriptional regulator AlpA